jgi:exodeoxyribonuclease VII small subunit
MATFEEKLAALELVVERLERGELALEESVRLFEEGVGLSNACKAQLDVAEGRIQVLMEPEGGGVRDLVVEDGEGEDDVEEDEDGE